MKLLLVLVVLCALIAAICARPEPRHFKHQLKIKHKMSGPAGLVHLQRRMWLPFKESKLRRQSEEAAVIEDPAAAEPDQVAAIEELTDEAEVAAEVPAVAAEEEAAAVDGDSGVPAVNEDAGPAAIPSFPPHTFFPMNFGHTAGGSVAVANSFSTGAGNAYSHAVAHGHQKH